MIVGTPGYLSPAAAQGETASPQMDLCAAGLVLPDHADADDRLRAVVQRAIARDPADRYGSAASLRDALMQWLAPADSAALDTRIGHGTLDFLLRRMRHKSDFPALTEHVLRIQRMANSDTDNLNQVAEEILKDVALTHKLLRLVNTMQYRRDGFAAGTVSRAVALVGLAGIRNLALSLVLVDHTKHKDHAHRLKHGFYARCWPPSWPMHWHRPRARPKRPFSAQCCTTWTACWRRITFLTRRRRSGSRCD